MDRRRVAGTDLDVSTMGFGAASLGQVYGPLDDTAAAKLIRTAIELGINYFDTSPYYGRGLSESRLGTAVAGIREQIIISTKAGRYNQDFPSEFDFSRKRITASIDESLRRLKTDYLDIVFLHDIEYGDRHLVLGEAVTALRDARRAGKIRHIGVSGYPLDVLCDAVSACNLDIVLSYCHGDLLDHGVVDELVPIALANQTAVVSASPFHMGLLTTAEPPTWHPAGIERRWAAARIATRCEALDLTLSSAAIAYALSLDGPTTVLCGAVSVEQLNANVAATNHAISGNLLDNLASLHQHPERTRWHSGTRWTQRN